MYHHLMVYLFQTWIMNEIFYIRLPDDTYRIYGESWIVAGSPAKIDKDVENLVSTLKNKNVKYIDADSKNQK